MPKNESRDARSSEPRGERGRWVTPAVIRMRAGDAEAGANPIQDEGTFAQGS